MLKKISFFVLFSAGISSIQAQQIIPFRLTKYNTIIVKALVNKKDSLDLMFQIAMKEGAISPDRQGKADHIIFNKDEISDHNTVEVGKIALKDFSFINNQLSGNESDGKIGTALFAGKTFKIDYDNDQFIIYDQKPDVKGYQPVTTFFHDDTFTIVADNVIENQQKEAYFVLQSGYSGSLLYSNEFSEENHLGKKLKITGEKTLKNSSGKSLITQQAILPFFKLGDVVFKDLSIAFFGGELKTQNVSYFGADMLRRFIWIFDAERKTAYIKPSKYFSEPYYKIN
nr:hypothetical protein [uncultured Chryseobacterium sp.]